MPPERPLRGIQAAAAWAVFIALCYAPDLAPPRSITFASLMVFWSFFTLTLIILCDQITLSIEQRSLLGETTANGHAWRSLIVVGAVSGLLLDGIAQWLGKLWIYPYWNEAVYGATFVIGFCAYWLAVAETYLAVKTVLRRLHPARPPMPARRDSDAILFRALAVVGAALVIGGVILLLKDIARSADMYSRSASRFRCRLISPISSWCSPAFGCCLNGCSSGAGKHLCWGLRCTAIGPRSTQYCSLREHSVCSWKR